MVRDLRWLLTERQRRMRWNPNMDAAASFKVVHVGLDRKKVRACLRLTVFVLSCVVLGKGIFRRPKSWQKPGARTGRQRYFIWPTFPNCEAVVKRIRLVLSKLLKSSNSTGRLLNFIYVQTNARLKLSSKERPVLMAEGFTANVLLRSAKS